MKKNRRHTIAAVTAGLIAGGAVGFVAGVPALTSAADVTIDSTVDSADADAGHDHGERRGPGGRGGRGGEQIATVAEVIGVDAEALREAFAAGQSVADVAEANGVALDDVVAAVVEQMETHIAEHVAEGKLTQEEADVKLADAADKVAERLSSVPTERGEGERRGPGGRRGEQMATGVEVIGVDADALREAFAAGQSVADVAEANGVALDDVVAAVVEQMETHIAEHVAEGKLTQEEADVKLADAADKVAERLSSVPTERGMGERGMGDHGGRRGPGGRGEHGPHGADHDEAAEVTTNA